MKYANEIIINLSRDLVLEKFYSSEILAKWQEDFISFKHLRSELSEAVLNLNYYKKLWFK